MDIQDKNIEFGKGIVGKITFKNIQLQCLAVYGSLLRREEISIGNTVSKTTSYQNIQLTFGEAAVDTYDFYYSLPKNYSCETHSSTKGLFGMSFAFGLRIVLKNGMIISKSVPIVIYRIAPPAPPAQETDEEDVDKKD